MGKRKHNSPCYFCGELSTSNEHAPPKQMFRAFSCDSITVPSCEQHNSSKGGHDQAIISAFLIPLSNSAEKIDLEEDILKALKKAQSSFERVKRRAINSPMLKNPPEILKDLPNLAYLISEIDIEGWIKQLTAALVWDCTRAYDSTIDWLNSIAWSPDWISARGPASIEHGYARAVFEKNKKMQNLLDQLAWADGWSAYPHPYPNTIYAFQVHFEPNNEVIFRHRFYGRYSWYAWFSASSNTVASLKKKLSSVTN